MLQACSSQDLDRETAESLILESSEAAGLGMRVSAVQGYMDEGEAQGLWSTERTSVPVLSAQASQHINQLASDHLVPSVSQSINVTVTGVTATDDNSTVSSADFSWKYKDLPNVIRRVAIPGGLGTAAFQRFDDGWRLAQVSFNVDESTFSPDQALQAEIQRDKQAEAKRRGALFEMVRASLSKGAVLRTFRGEYYGNGHQYDITENGVVEYVDTVENGRYTGKLVQSRFIWLGSIYNPRLGDWGILYDDQPETQINPSRMDTNHWGLNSQDFLTVLVAAHKSWTKKYGKIPINLRNDAYNQFMQEARQGAN